MSIVFAPAPAPSYVPPRTGGSAAPAHAPAHAPARPARRARPGSRPQPRQAPTTRPNLRVVQPGERTMRRLTPLGGVVLSAILFAVLATLAGAHTLIAQGQIHLDGVDAKVQVEQARYQQLRRDLAQAESPERVVAAAEAAGMVTPNDLVYLQPPTDDGVRSDSTPSDEVVARDADASWGTVKPMLGTPTP